MKIKKNTFSALVLELFFPSLANCIENPKNPKIDFPYWAISSALAPDSTLKNILTLMVAGQQPGQSPPKLTSQIIISHTFSWDCPF
jgi:hypothetical protein